MLPRTDTGGSRLEVARQCIELVATVRAALANALADALAYFGRQGQGVEALATLLDVLGPDLGLPRALLRGRYAAAVARVEAVGIPFDIESFDRLRDGWERVQDTLIEQVDRDYGVFRGRKFCPRRWAAWLNRNGIRWPRLDGRRCSAVGADMREREPPRQLRFGDRGGV